MKLLVVDLDETLIKTDLLYEMIFAYIKKNPFAIFSILLWATKGKVHLKNSLAKHISPKVEFLPYRKEVLDVIEEKKKQDFKTVLASASALEWVQKVSSHLGLFDAVIGTDQINIKGARKHDAIVSRFGASKYTYVGDSHADINVWKECGKAIAVNPSRATKTFLVERNILELEINDKLPQGKLLLKQMRIHQWAKNALIFLPLLAAHKINEATLTSALWAFVSFSLAASSVYIFNDLIDINSDRLHHSKKNRPLASGSLKILDAILIFFGLIAASFGIALHNGMPLTSVIALYWLLNVIYTFYLKKEPVLDIILLSSMYTIRIFAGAVGSDIPLSHWLLSFSTLFFFSLACIKRYTEMSRSQTKPTIDGRGYRGIDQPTVHTLGVGSGLISILIILLYLQSPEVRVLYKKIDILWLLNPILLYWIGRLWLLAGRNEVHDDPVVFAIKDKVSWLCFAGILLLMVSAT